MKTQLEGARSTLRRVAPLATLILTLSLSGCGGDNNKTYNTYGQTEAAFRTASPVIASQSGDVQLIATGSEWNVNFDALSMRIDPVTGQLSVTPGTGATVRNLIVGFLLGMPKPAEGGFTTPATEWTPKTVWVFTDNVFISTQQIIIQSGGAFAVFEDPPIGKRDTARMTVEYVSGTRSVLISSSLTWM